MFGALGLAAGLGASGCAVALVGAGAVGGYAISRDRAELTVEKPFAEVWRACLAEAKEAGRLHEVEEEAGRIETRRQALRITFRVERVTETSVKILITARKHWLPKVDEAQRLATRLARRLD